MIWGIWNHQPTSQCKNPWPSLSFALLLLSHLTLAINAMHVTMAWGRGAGSLKCWEWDQSWAGEQDVCYRAMDPFLPFTLTSQLKPGVNGFAALWLASLPHVMLSNYIIDSPPPPFYLMDSSSNSSSVQTLASTADGSLGSLFQTCALHAACRCCNLHLLLS